MTNPKERIALIGLVVLALILLGCQQTVVCESPYLRVGTDCCLDQNANRICDRDETLPVAQPATTAVAQTTPPRNTCTSECDTDQCNGHAYIECQKTAGCGKLSWIGNTIGKCGVECITNADCHTTATCQDDRCVERVCRQEPYEDTESYSDQVCDKMTVPFTYRVIQEECISMPLVDSFCGQAPYNMCNDCGDYRKIVFAVSNQDSAEGTFTFDLAVYRTADHTGFEVIDTQTKTIPAQSTIRFEKVWCDFGNSGCLLRPKVIPTKTVADPKSCRTITRTRPIKRYREVCT